jgi:hypothetical protein
LGSPTSSPMGEGNTDTGATTGEPVEGSPGSQTLCTRLKLPTRELGELVRCPLPPTTAAGRLVEAKKVSDQHVRREKSHTNIIPLIVPNKPASIGQRRHGRQGR